MLIVGTDFSATAALALTEARTLAAQLGVPLRAVHIRPGPLSAEWVADEDQKSWLAAVSLDEDQLTVRRGTPWVELVRLARESRARMIVVGTHGHSGFQPVTLGSTAARLAVLSPLPVVLVGTRDRATPKEGSPAGTPFTRERTGE